MTDVPKRGPSTASARPRRAPRHVKAAARILEKEARKILRRHARRIAPPAAEAMRASLIALDAHRAAEDWPGVEDQAEVLDELLHQHASFARKSALRETLENVGIAVGVAVALRSCLYEPFKIPSGSMMPTLRTGDHIFVNKFVYGIQIPFTTTVVGTDMFDQIRRGDVVVFRYPLDESEDFIKRVIGLPGDVVRVEGREVWIRRAGDDQFEAVQRTPIDARCLDDAGVQVVEHCQIFEEFLDGRSYEVRYLTDGDARGEGGARTFEVPADALFVMGDNRNLSHDSLQWTAAVEAVSADRVLNIKDLRDLTTETLFTVTRPRGEDANQDPRSDSVLYLADHRAPGHDLRLDAWREPVLGVDAVVAALRAGLADPQDTSIAALLEQGEQVQPGRRPAVLAAGADIDRVLWAKDETALRAVFTVREPAVVFSLACGVADCRDPSRLAERMTEIVAAWHADHEQDARELVQGGEGVRYGQQWRSRSESLHERFTELAWADPRGQGARAEVTLRVFRGVEEGVGLVRDAALAAAGARRPDLADGAGTLASSRAELGEDAWIVETADAWHAVLADHERELVVALACGKGRCSDEQALMELTRPIHAKLGVVAREAGRVRELLGQKDIGSWPERPTRSPAHYEWDHVALQATVRGGSHTLSLRVRHEPDDPAALEAALEELRATIPQAAPDQTLGVPAWSSSGPGGHRFAIAAPATHTALLLQCGPGLCPDLASARALAARAVERAQDVTAFVDPAAERSRPFVPRGNVKGRAERIWLPFSRFWLPVR